MKYDKWISYKKYLAEIYGIRDEFYNSMAKSKKYKSRTYECWHYTSMKSIINIFKSFIASNDKVINSFNLYASNIRYMNDSQEYEDGMALFSEMADHSKYRKYYDLNNPNADAYIVSFCENGDLLSQWRGYGKQSGVSFCFLENNAMYKIYTETDSGGNTTLPFHDGYTKPLPVIYDPEMKRKLFKKLEKLLYSKDNPNGSNLDLLASLFIPFCKNDYFFEEREQRLVFYTTDGIKPRTNNKISFDYIYNTFGETVKPALNVTVERKFLNQQYNYSDEFENDGPLISKMIVGPGNNQQIVFNTLIHLFDRTNRDNYMFLSENDISYDDGIEGLPDEESIIADNKVHRIQCVDGKERNAYRCSNGLLIMKSDIPFRS